MKTKMIHGSIWISGCAVLSVGLYLITKNGILLSIAITFGTIAYHFLMRLIVGAIYNGAFHNQEEKF